MFSGAVKHNSWYRTHINPNQDKELTMSESISYEYDDSGRLVLITYSDDTEIAIEYDDAGNRESVTTTVT